MFSFEILLVALCTHDMLFSTINHRSIIPRSKSHFSRFYFWLEMFSIFLSFNSSSGADTIKSLFELVFINDNIQCFVKDVVR